MNTPAWTLVPTAPATKVLHVTGQDLSCYYLGQNGEIHRYNHATSTWHQISSPSPNKLSTISAGHDGTLMALDENGSVFMFQHGHWIGAGYGLQAIHIVAGDEHRFVMISPYGETKEYNHGIISNISSTGPVKLAVTQGLKHVWGLSRKGEVFKKEGKVWLEIPGILLSQIDIALYGENTVRVCGVDHDGVGWTYDGYAWTRIDNPLPDSKFLSLEVSGHCIWASLSNGEVYIGTFQLLL